MQGIVDPHLSDSVELRVVWISEKLGQVKQYILQWRGMNFNAH